MVFSLYLVALVASLLAAARPPSDIAKRCTGTISSLNDVTNAVVCTTVNINAFTVPAGSTFNLNLLDGTTVNLNGNIAFGNVSWTGPLFQISSFNGNGHSFDGGGPFYWDGLGSNGGVTKPRPMMNYYKHNPGRIKISGTFSNTKVINSPAQTFSVSNPAALTITGITIDNSQGDNANSKSNGTAAGHNTDGFDCSTTNLIIQNSSVKNQDDCLAINKGSNITFKGNTCSGGHGISIGSISSGVTVFNIMITGNTITNNDQALRIKMDSDATGSTVSNITYSGNTGTGLRNFGVLIDQSYPSTLKTPGTGVILSVINFLGSTNTISVSSSATPVAVNCGKGACTGTWNWSNLKTSGGKANFKLNPPTITGYTL
ncbi:glycoside hydrolase family 28 protein [Sphaerobolus stellatus SS14]|uniref:endo-polygalacturonase n=1 Tax=Sphaerobolus stellatus (strain SS14) TaxID=990650 RepID=A0A0C9VUI0_SPHS4|nr:glycoside hydrolase family 28 protein [Sphaerobolus stellatus SS14]